MLGTSVSTWAQCTWVSDILTNTAVQSHTQVPRTLLSLSRQIFPAATTTTAPARVLPARNLSITGAAFSEAGKIPLDEVDPEIRELLRREKERQVSGLELIAAEVYSLVAQCVGVSNER